MAVKFWLLVVKEVEKFFPLRPHFQWPFCLPISVGKFLVRVKEEVLHRCGKLLRDNHYLAIERLTIRKGKEKSDGTRREFYRLFCYISPGLSQ